MENKGDVANSRAAELSTMVQDVCEAVFIVSLSQIRAFIVTTDGGFTYANSQTDVSITSESAGKLLGITETKTSAPERVMYHY